MRHHHLAGHFIIVEAIGIRKAGAGRGKRLKPEPLKDAGRPDIPGVGNEEAPAVMEGLKGDSLVVLGDHVFPCH